MLNEFSICYNRKFLFFCNKMTSEHMDKKYIVKRTVCIEVDLPFKNGMLQLQEHSKEALSLSVNIQYIYIACLYCVNIDCSHEIGG